MTSLYTHYIMTGWFPAVFFHNTPKGPCRTYRDLPVD